MYLGNSFLFICFFSTIKCFSLFGNRNGINYLLKEKIDLKWIEQPVDHFNKTDNRKWKMRYLQRLDLWKAGGPIYLFIGGEFESDDAFLQEGTLYDLAHETNGAMFFSEHRYYGESKPFKDFTTENLRYLSSRQALADIALLLENIKTRPKLAESKVVVVGGSYGANLAAWLKLLYPDLADATIASSGPVIAKTDFYEYNEIVGINYKKYGSPKCYEKIEHNFKDYEKKLETEDGIEQLKKEFYICPETDMTKLENKQLFFYGASNFYSHYAQWGDVHTIKKVCNIIENDFNIFRIEEFLGTKKKLLIWNEKDDCFDCEFNNYIQMVKKEYKNMMVYIYQSCTESGHFRSTTSDNQPFTKNIPVDFYLKMCSAFFGKEFDGKRVEKGVKKTNELYGGLHPNVSKVVFVNGELDPWHTLSVLEDISSEAPAKVIPLSNHCRDLSSDQDDDPKELKEARKYIKNLVKKWIGVAGINFKN